MCLWNNTEPYLPTKAYPYTVKQVASPGTKKAKPCFLACKYGNEDESFGIPSCFFRINFTSAIDSVPVVYLRWLATATVKCNYNSFVLLNMQLPVLFPFIHS